MLITNQSWNRGIGIGEKGPDWGITVMDTMQILKD